MYDPFCGHQTLKRYQNLVKKIREKPILVTSKAITLQTLLKLVRTTYNLPDFPSIF